MASLIADRNTDRNTATQQLNHQIFGNELILDKVFTSLSLKELLLVCSPVNRLWWSAARRAITSRTRVQHVFQLFRIGNPHIGGNSQESHLRDGQRLAFVGDSFEALEDGVRRAVDKELYAMPRLVIAFYGNFCPHSKRTDGLMHYRCFRQFLPPDCQLFNAVTSCGIVGSPVTVDSSGRSAVEPIETQARVGNCAGVSLVLFARLASVEIDVFDEKNLIPLEKLNARTDLKCLLVFATSCTTGKNQFKEFASVNQLLEKYENKLAIGGVVIDDMNFFANNISTTRKKSRHFFGLAFSGPNVKACSLVLQTDRQERTEAKLRQFRQNLAFDPHCRGTQTIAFIFICAGRGINTYGDSNVESALFRKVFPDIQLFGVYGQGEYGHDYWPAIANSINSNACDDQLEHRFWHFYTTILVVINLPTK